MKVFVNAGWLVYRGKDANNWRAGAFTGGGASTGNETKDRRCSARENGSLLTAFPLTRRHFRAAAAAAFSVRVNGRPFHSRSPPYLASRPLGAARSDFQEFEAAHNEQRRLQPDILRWNRPIGGAFV